MTRIAYLLHRFPGLTDTFIRREIRALQRAGTTVKVVSVWRPEEPETTPQILAQWEAETHFVLPRSPLRIAKSFLKVFFRNPARFFSALGLAFFASPPGFRGSVYQAYYFVESVLVAEILQREAFDHVHNHIGDQSGTVTMLAAKIANIGYSITFHGWPVFFDAINSRIKEKVRGSEFTRSISYFCRSQLMMFSECEDPSSFKVVHCGLSIEEYDYRAPREQISRLFCAARLSPEKGHSVTLKALKIMRDRGHELEYRIAGDGPSKGHLIELSCALGIADQVRFLGNLTELEIIHELQASDLFVLSSFVEGIPVSAMEAMAVGVPVIATNVAGTSELIESGETGILVRPSDPEALADAILAMMEDYSFRVKAARLGRHKVADEFDVDKESAKLRKYLLEACVAHRQ